MDNSGKFPLLRLPFLAIKEVLNEMKLFDLVNFSLTSSKTKIITKTITRTRQKRYEIYISFHSTPTFHINRGRGELCIYKITSDRSECENFNFHYHATIYKYAKNVLEGFKDWSEYVIEVLSCQVKNISFDTDCFEDQHKSVIDWSKSISEVIETVSIDGSNLHATCNDEIVPYILQNLRITKRLDLFVNLSEHFDFSLFPASLEHICIMRTNSKTLQNLVKLDSLKIWMRHSESLNTQDYTQFFLSWMTSESNLKLTDLQAEVPSDYDLNGIVEGVPHEIIGEEVERDLSGNGQMIKGGIDIIRIDGKRATLYMTDCWTPRYYTLNMFVH